MLDRFGQIEPRVLVAADGYFYGGKTHDIRPRVAEVTGAAADGRTGRRSCRTSRRDPSLDGIARRCHLGALRRHGHSTTLEFARLPFNHPLYILYSSGTTGVPKCIVHGAGGTLIQHLKEHQLHCDIQPGDRVFYFTTCGWMMWNWLVTALASDATLLLYDGSPFHPGRQRALRLRRRHRR